MEPPGGLPSDKDGQSVVHQQPNSNSLKQQGPQSQLQRHLHHQHHHQNHHHHNHQSSQLQQQQPQLQSQAIPLQQQQLQLQHSGLINITPGSQPTIEKLSRPMAFDKMESLVREMQVPVHGVPVRQQKMFLTSIPYAFMGYDLIEWLMDRLIIEESEALNIANQLCLHGYFFPVNDTKTLTVKDDSSLYRFQTPYYWPWQHKAPDNVEYAIYLAKRSLRNKQRHALEDYESEALASLHKNLKGKWDFIAMQADEQVRLAKERKKGDKIVGDSQERAYWRVHRPPPGQFTPLEPCPVPSRERQGIKAKKKTVEDWQLEVEYLRKSLTRTRMKMSQACESLVSYSETFSDYEFFLQPVLPSNPWVSEDITFWQLNNALVETATEKRVRRWAISIEELVSDPTGLNEFTTFLEKEYSHENIRFWIEVNKLRRSAHSRVASKVNDIYEEFLKPGARCEINIDGKTMELVQRGLKNPSRFTFDAAAEHIYMLLLKKDCYPRFVRSDHYKNLLANSIQPLHKKRFFNFGGVGVKKKMAVIPSTLASQSQMNSSTGSNVVPGHLTRRRGSDRSLSGSVHELAVIGIKDTSNKVPHSHSQSNLSDISYREGPKPMEGKLETTLESATAVCPWDDSDANQNIVTSFHVSICPWEQEDAQANTSKRLASTSSDISDVSDRMTRACGLRQNTVDSSDYNTKRLTLECTEQRRASISLVPRISDFHRSVETASLTVPICVSDVAIPSSTTVVNDSVEASDDNEPRMDTKISETDDSMPPPSEKTTTTEEIEIVADDDVNDEVIELPCLETEVQIELIEIDKFDESLITLNASDEGPYPGTTVKETTPKLVREDSILLPEDPFIDAKPKCSDEHMGEDLEDYRPKKTDSTIPVTCITEPGKRSSPDVIPNSNTNNVSNQEESQSSQENPLLECGAESNAICEETMQVDIEIYPASRTPPTNIPIPHCSDSGEQLKEAKSPGDNEKAETRDEDAMLQEELSPATEEYQEIQLGGRTESYDYDIDDVITPGCVAPAPTPAPLLAPLAEIDLDPVEDELEHPPKKAEGEEGRKKRKKHNVESKKSEDKVDKPSHSKEHLAAALEKKESPDHKTVCPWEDEDVTASDTTFVKTYATLGYL